MYYLHCISSLEQTEIKIKKGTRRIMNQEMETSNHPQEQVLEEEELLLLQETAAMNASSSFFNEPAATTERFTHLHLNNRHQPPCTSCGCNKRPSSENPITHLQPYPKKPNTASPTHSLFGFSKIPLSPPPFLRRCSSDPYIPPLPPVMEEPPLSSSPNAEPECPGTPLSNAIASNKLPPRPPTLKRSVSELLPSPAKTASGPSSDNPHAKWLTKMRDCMRDMSRKWDELLGDEEDTSNEEINKDNSSRGVNNESNNDATLENYEGGYVEAVSMEKKGEALILHFKCPCGAGYQILLLGGNCYYKLMMLVLSLEMECAELNSFITNDHCEEMQKHKLIDFFVQFLEDNDKEISELKMSVNTRGRLVATEFLKQFV